MRAIRLIGTGREARLELGDAEPPKLGADQVRIRVRATAVNRADLMQRRGVYPPPPGASEILGLECAGDVLEVAEGVSGVRAGERVMALLAGGGYAQETCAHAGSVMSLPSHLSYEVGAAIPEVFLTCYLNLFQIGEAPPGGVALVHGGGSGIGTSSIQLLRHAGVRVIVTAGSEAKLSRCRELGADLALDYRAGDFAPAALEFTEGRGVDLVLDSIGARYLASHLRCLALGGRLILIGLMGGARAELDLAQVVAKRLRVIGSTLRSRSVAEKTEIVRGFEARFGGAVRRGELGPIIDRVLPLERAQEAHELLERSEHFGKVVLSVA